MNNKSKTNKGITLITLVITVIVLLILAGTAISIALSGDNIFTKANTAVNAANAKAIEQTYNILALEGNFDVYYSSYNSSQAPGEAPTGLTVPTDLAPGDTVTWKPSGHYEWNKEYYSDDDDTTKILYSGTEATGKSTSTEWNDGVTDIDMTIETWKVLKISSDRKTVTLVPATPTVSGVKLRGAQGYNNAVKLLDEACSNLYGNYTGVSARSIDMEDIEGLMDTTAVSTAKGNVYPVQVSSAYDPSYSQYPLIYEEEAYSNINKGSGAVEVSASNGLGMSEEATANLDSNGFIARTGKVTNATGIQPYKTYYYMNNSTFATALGYPTDTETNKKLGLLLPNGSSTRNYWVASRCVNANDGGCDFYVRNVRNGGLNGYRMFYSGNYTDSWMLGLFPVVSLNSGVLSGANHEYTFNPAS